MTPLPLTELNKLIEGDAISQCVNYLKNENGIMEETDYIDYDMYMKTLLAAAPALPNALKLIEELKKDLQGVKSRLFNEHNSAQNRLMSAYDVAHKALSRIAAFEANVLQQGEM